MKNKKKILLAICIMVLSMCCFANRADAAKAKKATMEAYDQTIGICKNYDWCNVSIKNKVKNAKYTFKSSNNKIVKVKKVIYGESLILESFNYGTAKIILTEKYKGKSRKVGSFKVTVKKTELYKNASCEFCYGEKSKYVHMSWADVDDEINIYNLANYVNEKATYSFYSKDNKIFKIGKNGKSPSFYQMKNTEVTVKETYQKKTRVVGKVKVKPIAPSCWVDGETYYAQKDREYDITYGYNGLIAYPVWTLEKENGDTTIIKGKDGNVEDRTIIMKISETGKYNVTIYAALNDKYDITNNAIQVGKMTLNVVDDLKLYVELYDYDEVYNPGDTIKFNLDYDIYLNVRVKSELGENFFIENDFSNNVNLTYTDNGLVNSIDKDSYLFSKELRFIICPSGKEGDMQFSLEAFGKTNEYTLSLIDKSSYEDDYDDWDNDYSEDDNDNDGDYDDKDSGSYDGDDNNGDYDDMDQEEDGC